MLYKDGEDEFEAEEQPSKGLCIFSLYFKEEEDDIVASIEQPLNFFKLKSF